jgi:site-specific recombinase XerD
VIEGTTPPCPTLMQARTRRVELLLELLLQTGMRLDEVAISSASSMFAAQVDGNIAAGEFALQVVGRKRKKVRTVYVPAVVKDLI